jgi:hypothetical protein
LKPLRNGTVYRVRDFIKHFSVELELTSLIGIVRSFEKFQSTGILHQRVWQAL